MYNLKEKTVIITGSEGDIGKELVKAFKKEEAYVYGFDIKTGFDVTNDMAINTEVADIFEENNKIDILINNAGISNASYKDTIDVNLTGTYNMIKAVAKYMQYNHSGSIINITSLWAEQGFGFDNPQYGASKGGIKSMTKAFACDLGQYNIRVNNVGFGYIKTKMTEKSWNDLEKRKQIENRTILGRWGTSEDVIGVILFLASNASQYITGQDIYVDGGWLAKGL
jgi:NAD(P)-dependent dehydrogenase (short-subunit alcohol dehydrogenase family)